MFKYFIPDDLKVLSLHDTDIYNVSQNNFLSFSVRFV